MWIVCSPSSDLVREELPVGRLRRRPESSREVAAVWVNKAHHSLYPAFSLRPFILVFVAQGKRADIIRPRGCGAHDACLEDIHMLHRDFPASASLSFLLSVCEKVQRCTPCFRSLGLQWGRLEWWTTSDVQEASQWRVDLPLHGPLQRGSFLFLAFC